MSCCDLHCFAATSILSHFTHFCVEQKFTEKSCLWSKNDKYHVWLPLVELCIIQFCHLAREFWSVHWVWKRNVLGQQNESSQKYFTHSSHSLLSTTLLLDPPFISVGGRFHNIRQHCPSHFLILCYIMSSAVLNLTSPTTHIAIQTQIRRMLRPFHKVNSPSDWSEHIQRIKVPFLFVNLWIQARTAFGNISGKDAVANCCREKCVGEEQFFCSNSYNMSQGRST